MQNRSQFVLLYHLIALNKY